MRFAHRSQGFHAHSEQQVEIFTGTTPNEAAVKLSEFIAGFAIKVVSLSHWQQQMGHNAQHSLYGITAVLEEEPDHRRAII